MTTKGSDPAFPVPVGADYYGMDIRTWLAGQWAAGQDVEQIISSVKAGELVVLLADATIDALNATPAEEKPEIKKEENNAK